MVPNLQHPPLPEDIDHISMLDRRQPVRNRNRRPPLGDLLQRSRDLLLALRVERRRRLVQQEDLGVSDDGPRDGCPLLLPAGQRHAAGADIRVVAVGQRHDEVVDGGVTTGLVQLGVGDRRLVGDTEKDILLDSA